MADVAVLGARLFAGPFFCLATLRTRGVVSVCPDKPIAPQLTHRHPP
ncbi:MAG TPA: hypothetical protein VN638_12565 [Nitrospiraceae bacterium]|nr:hypothetical protein [Nitrospiraceae bacterium]